MSKVQASELDIYARYDCPECEWPHWLSEKQFSHAKFLCVCDCGNTFKPAKPKQLDNSAPVVKPSKAKTNFVQQAIDILLEQGFDAASLRKAAKGVNCKTVEDTVQQIILNI